MQLLEPLAIEDVGFLARDIFEVTCIDQTDLDTLVLKDFIKRDPVDTSGFHGDTGDVTLLEPGGQLVKVAGERGEAADALLVAVGGHGDIDFGGANINASGIGVDCLERLGKSSHTYGSVGSGCHSVPPCLL